MEIAHSSFTENSLFIALNLIDARRAARQGTATESNRTATGKQFLIKEVKEDLIATLGLVHSHGQSTQLLLLQDLWVENYRQERYDKKYVVLLIIDEREIPGVLYLKENRDAGIHQYEFISDNKDYFINGEGSRQRVEGVSKTIFNWSYKFNIGETKSIAHKEEDLEILAAFNSRNEMIASEFKFLSPGSVDENAAPVFQRIFTERNGAHWDYYTSFDHAAPYWYLVEERVEEYELSGSYRILELENGSLLQQGNQRYSEIQLIEGNKKNSEVSLRIIDSEHEEAIIVDKAQLQNHSEGLICEVLREI